MSSSEQLEEQKQEQQYQQRDWRAEQSRAEQSSSAAAVPTTQGYYVLCPPDVPARSGEAVREILDQRSEQGVRETCAYGYGAKAAAAKPRLIVEIVTTTHGR